MNIYVEEKIELTEVNDDDGDTNLEEGYDGAM